MRTILATACLFLLVMGACPLQAQGGEPDRAAFARAMNAVTKGMTAEDVVHLLGTPDDIRTHFDPDGISTSRTTEIWGYGTAGHLTFPTLGCIFMASGGVQYVYGGKGVPPDSVRFNEAELEKILRLLDSATDDGGRNPLNYIKIVNTLLPLGKDKGLAAIDEYCRVSSEFLSDPIPLFLVLRLLFEVPENPGFMPPMRMGRPSVAEPEDHKLLPLFPVVLLDDIPLNLVNSYCLAGLRQPVAEHLAYFRKNGKWREHPLLPANNPLGVLDKLEHSPQWIYHDQPGSSNYQWSKGLLAEQLLDLIDTVYRIEPDQHGNRQPDAHFDPQRWDRIIRDVSALHIKWDAAKNIYVFADGTSLPAIRKPIYMRLIWQIPGLGPNAELICRRMNKDYVMLSLQCAEFPGIVVQESIVKVYQTGVRDRPLAEYRIPYSAGGNSSSQSSKDVMLPAGESLQAEITTGRQTTKSAVLTP